MSLGKKFNNCRRCRKHKELDKENLCSNCSELKKQKEDELYTQFFGIDKVTEGFRTVLEGLQEVYNLDLSDPNFLGTPERCGRAYAEIFSGMKNTEEQVKSILNSQFPSNSDEIVMSKNIRVFSMCPHHLLPVDYRIDVAYLPGNSVIGISKLTRLVEILAKRPVLQETLTNDIADTLSKIEGCQGSACVAHGKHYCMIMRGVKQPDAPTITSSVRGKFRDDAGIKQEFQQCSVSNREV